jgi:hypothetical protein
VYTATVAGFDGVQIGEKKCKIKETLIFLFLIFFGDGEEWWGWGVLDGR